LGGLLVMNTWDVAPFWPLYVGGSWLFGRALPTRERVWRPLVAPALGLALFIPYFVGYASPPLGLDLVRDRLGLNTFLVLFGGQTVLLTLVGIWLRARTRDRFAWIVAGVGVAALVVFTLRGEYTLGVLLLLASLYLPLPESLSNLAAPEHFTLLLGGFAVAMLLGVELIFLKDSFGTRMNTVFKFHYNAWLLAGTASGIGVVLVAQAKHWSRYVALTLAAVVLAVGLVYPVSAIATRLSERPPGGPTLDGYGFLASDERAAIEWLRTQTGDRRPVVAEGIGGEYSSAARMASYAGVVDVLGWAGHELQWRGPLPELGIRDADMDLLYKTADPSGIRSILDRYNVDYVVVGDVERQKYGDGVDTRFRDQLPVAFQSGRVTIYRAR
jgi:uncharacterized membrane protein